MEPPIASPWEEPPVEPEETEREFLIPQLGKEVRARIRETHYGRACGWIVELRGEPIALFSECEYADMFWEWYKVTLLTKDTALLALMENESFFWDFEEEITFRNREFPDVPLPWSPMIRFAGWPERAFVRGLYLVIDPPVAPRPPGLWARLMRWLGYWR